jgi:hypothetical protein
VRGLDPLVAERAEENQENHLKSDIRILELLFNRLF